MLDEMTWRNTSKFAMVFYMFDVSKYEREKAILVFCMPSILVIDVKHNGQILSVRLVFSSSINLLFLKSVVMIGFASM